jgi:hypothetical protein
LASGGKIIDFKNEQIVKLLEVQFIDQSKPGIHGKKPKKKNEKRSVLPEVSFQRIVFNKFI